MRQTDPHDGAVFEISEQGNRQGRQSEFVGAQGASQRVAGDGRHQLLPPDENTGLGSAKELSPLKATTSAPASRPCRTPGSDRGQRRCVERRAAALIVEQHESVFTGQGGGEPGAARW